MLMKHPDRCRYPHGHTRRIEVVVSAQTLDANDMVCDFKALKLALHACIDRFDHSMAINSEDPLRPALEATPGARIVVFENADPTTEVLARHIYEHLRSLIAADAEFCDATGDGIRYRLPRGLRVERVRVGETSSTWAEYAEH
jgi:6-pyruvoyltetrahydropterin/6-carboxytetrahydropterin synthase